MKICIISVYFGNFPNYFPLWLKSCKYNKTIDFLIVTDNGFLSDIPNVRVISMALSDMKSLAEKKIGMNIALDTPYKCCDFKPVYSVIFEDYVKDYDYVGCCDLDMIFGDLRCFFEKYDLTKYDKFLPLGHLTLYRNTDECNSRFKLIPSGKNSYTESFCRPETTQFDEIGGINAIYEENGFPYFKERIFADISHNWDRIKLIESYPGAKEKNYDYQAFYWQNGKIFRAFFDRNEEKNEEFIYIHIKKRKFSDISFDVESANGFYISPHSFSLKDDTGLPDKKTIKKVNPFYGALYEKIEYKYIHRGVRKIRKIFSRG